MKDPNSPSWLQSLDCVLDDQIRLREYNAPWRVMVGVLRSVWWIRDDRSPSFMVVRSRIPCIGE
jgi:hypothetical protein